MNNITKVFCGMVFALILVGNVSANNGTQNLIGCQPELENCTNACSSIFTYLTETYTWVYVHDPPDFRCDYIPYDENNTYYAIYANANCNSILPNNTYTGDCIDYISTSNRLQCPSYDRVHHQVNETDCIYSGDLNYLLDNINFNNTFFTGTTSTTTTTTTTSTLGGFKPKDIAGKVVDGMVLFTGGFIQFAPDFASMVVLGVFASIIIASLVLMTEGGRRAIKDLFRIE